MQEFIVDNIEGIVKIVLSLLALMFVYVQAHSKSKRLERSLAKAYGDLQFLLAVENEHCEEQRIQSGASNRNTIRKLVRETTAFEWSGSHTQEKLRAKVAKQRQERGLFAQVLNAIGLKDFEFS